MIFRFDDDVMLFNKVIERSILEMFIGFHGGKQIAHACQNQA